MISQSVNKAAESKSMSKTFQILRSTFKFHAIKLNNVTQQRRNNRLPPCNESVCFRFTEVFGTRYSRTFHSNLLQLIRVFCVLSKVGFSAKFGSFRCFLLQFFVKCMKSSFFGLAPFSLSLSNNVQNCALSWDPRALFVTLAVFPYSFIHPDSIAKCKQQVHTLSVR